MLDTLKGVTVLEVGVLTPGKYCGLLMTGWGATSIRIEREASDSGVTIEDMQLNRGKQSVVLNLRDEADRESLLELARTADVLIEGYRPGVAARLGIDYETVRAINPAIIYCSISGFGQAGPDIGRAAYDLSFMAESGVLHALHGNGSDVVAPQTYLADAATGVMAAFAISAALLDRNRTGQGRHIDLSMQETLFSMLSVSHGTIRDGVAVGAQASAGGSTRPAYNVYRTSDGRYVVISALDEKSRRALFQYLGNEEMWQGSLALGEAGREARAFLQQQLAEHDARHWIDALAPLGIEIALVKSPEEAFDSPQLQARNMVQESHDGAGRPLRQIGFPATARAAPQLDPAPVPGAHQQSLHGKTPS